MAGSARAADFVFKDFTVYSDHYKNQFYFAPDGSLTHLLTTFYKSGNTRQEVFEGKWNYQGDNNIVCWRYIGNKNFSGREFCFTVNEGNTLLQSTAFAESRYRVDRIARGKRLFLPPFLQKLAESLASSDLGVFAGDAGLLRRHIIGKSYKRHPVTITINPDNSYSVTLTAADGSVETIGQGGWRAKANILCLDDEAPPGISSFFSQCIAVLGGAQALYQGQGREDILIVTDKGQINFLNGGYR